MEPNVRRSIARVDVMQGEVSVSRGTGTLIGEKLVLTAYHVVGDRRTEGLVLVPGTIRLTFPDFQTEAEVHGTLHDRLADWLVLVCRTPPPREMEPVPLARLAKARGEWETFGFPDANPVEGMVQAGEVRSVEATLQGGTVLQLFSEEAAAGSGAPVRGLSGAPVLVGDTLVGVLRYALMDQGKTVAGTVFACPAGVVAEAAELPIRDMRGGRPVARSQVALAAAILAVAVVVVAMREPILDWISDLTREIPSESVAVFGFGEGGDMPEAVLANLRERIVGLLPGLGVISPQPRLVADLENEADLRVVRRSLGVANQLTGSVTPAGGGFEIFLALSRLPTGAPRWDTTLVAASADGILDFDEVIITRVAESLGVTVSEAERRRIDNSGTESVDAVHAFQRGKAFLTQSGGEALDSAIAAFTEAIAFDSTYIEAWVGRSDAHGRKVFGGWDPTEARKEMALADAQRAQSIDPDQVLGHMALGRYYYQNSQYDAALQQYREARRLQPRNVEALWLVASALRRQGEWAAAVDSFTAVSDADPTDAGKAYSAGQTAMLVRDYRRADRFVKRSLQGDPNNVVVVLGRAAYQVASGERVRLVRDGLRRWIDADNDSVTRLMFRGLMIDEFRPLLGILDDEQRSVLRAAPPSWAPADTVFYHLTKAWLFRPVDADSARAHAEAALALTRAREAMNPAMSEFHFDEAQALLAMGEHEAGVAKASQAVAETEDAYRKMLNRWYLASAHVVAGDLDAAFEAAEEALREPGYLSVDWMRADPLFAQMVADPRFRSLVAAQTGSGGVSP